MLLQGLWYHTEATVTARRSLPPFRLSGLWWQCSLPLPLQAFVVFLNPAHTSGNSSFLNPSYSKKIFIFLKKEIVLSLSPSSLTTWRQAKFTKSETIYRQSFTSSTEDTGVTPLFSSISPTPQILSLGPDLNLSLPCLHNQGSLLFRSYRFLCLVFNLPFSWLLAPIGSSSVCPSFDLVKFFTR